MKRSRYTEEQIIGIPQEQEAGTPVAELCRKRRLAMVCRLVHCRSARIVGPRRRGVRLSMLS